MQLQFQNRSYDGGRVGAYYYADSNIPLFFSKINYHPNLFQSELSVSAMKSWLLLLLCGITMMMVVTAAEGDHSLYCLKCIKIPIKYDMGAYEN